MNTLNSSLHHVGGFPSGIISTAEHHLSNLEEEPAGAIPGCTGAIPGCIIGRCLIRSIVELALYATAIFPRDSPPSRCL